MSTILRTRTEAERQRLIGERVARVLEDDYSPSPVNNGFTTLNLAEYWSLAAKIDFLRPSQLIAETFRHIVSERDSLNSDKSLQSEHLESDKQQPVTSVSRTNGTSFNLLSEQWLQF